jgi:FKBP-type peptidyl-prolyl cis-trans isomerase 2/predicted Fe-Mo cluster-binding NifX family protein
VLVAIPSDSPGGLESRISDHFGHCDAFTLVQIDEKQVESVTVVPNEAHEGGQCMAPVMRLKEQGADSLVAGGMGQRPLSGFQEVGITVYFKAGAETVRDAVELLAAGQCQEFAPAQTCGGHGECGSQDQHHAQIEREVIDGPIQKDCVALVAFQLTDIEGELIDAAEDIRYLHGHGQLLPGLEKALEGLRGDERTKATISPEDGYGERDESRVIQAPTEELPPGLDPGAMVRGQLPNGQVVPFTVVTIDGPTTTLDANHPLAGKTLVFDVEVREVYAATADDLAARHVH